MIMADLWRGARHPGAQTFRPLRLAAGNRPPAETINFGDTILNSPVFALGSDETSYELSMVSPKLLGDA
jgi:hypothetical protein